jgi:hypothetical protein
MKRLILSVILALSLVTAAFGQSECADLQKKFDAVRATPFNGDSWTAVQESLGTPSQSRQSNGRIASVVYSLAGCSAEFFISTEGKLYDKSFKLTSFPGAESATNPSPATDSAAAPSVSPEIAEAIKNLDSTLQQLKAQIAGLESMMHDLRKAAGISPPAAAVVPAPVVGATTGARGTGGNRSRDLNSTTRRGQPGRSR